MNGKVQGRVIMQEKGEVARIGNFELTGAYRGLYVCMRVYYYNNYNIIYIGDKKKTTIHRGIIVLISGYGL